MGCYCAYRTLLVINPFVFRFCVAGVLHFRNTPFTKRAIRKKMSIPALHPAHDTRGKTPKKGACLALGLGGLFFVLYDGHDHHFYLGLSLNENRLHRRQLFL